MYNTLIYIHKTDIKDNTQIENLTGLKKIINTCAMYMEDL